MGEWMDGWMDGWVGGWICCRKGVRASYIHKNALGTDELLPYQMTLERERREVLELPREVI
jgi:hypothetical protein